MHVSFSAEVDLCDTRIRKFRSGICVENLECNRMSARPLKAQLREAEILHAHRVHEFDQCDGTAIDQDLECFWAGVLTEELLRRLVTGGDAARSDGEIGDVLLRCVELESDLLAGTDARHTLAPDGLEVPVVSLLRWVF